MTQIQIDTSDGVRERSIRFVAADGVALSATWFVLVEPPHAPTTAVVVTCGAGIPAKFYRRFAHYLAGRGAAVLTFDYRGIGESREGSLRHLKVGMDAWAVLDLGAALAEARITYPQLPLSAVAHSVGTLYVGATPDAARLSRLVFFGPHTGYWRDYGRRWRWLMRFVWHVFMPAVTKRIGYFPGRALRLGEDLPSQVAFDWAARRQPELAANLDSARRFGPALSRYGETRADTLAISISDDAFAPPGAARRLLAMYPNLRAVHETVTPASLGCRRLGHLGFLRRPAGEYFWRRAAAWLIPEVDRAQNGESARASTAQMSASPGAKSVQRDAPNPPPPGV